MFFFYLNVQFQSLHNLTSSAKNNYDNILMNIKYNNTAQNNILLKQAILSSSSFIENSLKTSKESYLDLLTLEHIVNKFSFQKYYMEIMGIMTPDIEGIIRTIENKLIEIINTKFLSSYNNKDFEIITRCLRLYNNLGAKKVAYETYRIHVIKPYLGEVLTEKQLEKFNQDLARVYDEVFGFIDKEMNIINQIIEDNPDLKSYNFMFDSFWKEFDRQSRLGLPYITAPGNPELFRKRFSCTFQAILKIAEKCGNINLVKEDDTFQEHLKRFNLPVYFEIQYQKIAGEFESEFLIERHKMYASKNHLCCKLTPTIALYVGISKCFQDDVYIDQLADQFLKLALMLLSRYLKWFNLYLQVSYRSFIIILFQHFVIFRSRHFRQLWHGNLLSWMLFMILL